jgi:hypothetical protein
MGQDREKGMRRLSIFTFMDKVCLEEIVVRGRLAVVSKQQLTVIPSDPEVFWVFMVINLAFSF